MGDEDLRRNMLTKALVKKAQEMEQQNLLLSYYYNVVYAELNNVTIQHNSTQLALFWANQLIDALSLKMDAHEKALCNEIQTLEKNIFKQEKAYLALLDCTNEALIDIALLRKVLHQRVFSAEARTTAAEARTTAAEARATAAEARATAAEAKATAAEAKAMAVNVSDPEVARTLGSNELVTLCSRFMERERVITNNLHGDRPYYTADNSSMLCFLSLMPRPTSPLKPPTSPDNVMQLVHRLHGAVN